MFIKNIYHIVRDLYRSSSFSAGGFHNTERKLLSKYYNSDSTFCKKESSFVFMVDGRTVHGGLTDRIRAIVTIYSYCKDKTIPFYLYFIYPFNIEDYLVPNEYDWRISAKDLCFNHIYSQPALLNSHELSYPFHRRYLDKLAKQNKQIHIYSNSRLLDEEFSQNYRELFKPSKRLLRDLDSVSLSLNLTSNYVAIVTRFQQLLGDFKETGYKTLPKEDQYALINKCVKKIEELHNTDLQGKQILCTSDSITFLNEANKLPYVSIIPGTVVHMDHTSDASFETYEKSFLDLYMIAQAQKVILLQTEDMYPSGFPKRAAMIYNKPFIHLTF